MNNKVYIVTYYDYEASRPMGAFTDEGVAKRLVEQFNGMGGEARFGYHAVPLDDMTLFGQALTYWASFMEWDPETNTITERRWDVEPPEDSDSLTLMPWATRITEKGVVFTASIQAHSVEEAERILLERIGPAYQDMLASGKEDWFVTYPVHEGVATPDGE